MVRLTFRNRRLTKALQRTRLRVTTCAPDHPAFPPTCTGRAATEVALIIGSESPLSAAVVKARAASLLRIT